MKNRNHGLSEKEMELVKLLMPHSISSVYSEYYARGISLSLLSYTKLTQTL